MTAEGGTFENVNVSGSVNATSGIMSNITINGSSTFNGDIISGPLELTSSVPDSETVILKAGSYKNAAGNSSITFITGVSGTYGNVHFYTAKLTVDESGYKGRVLLFSPILQLYNQQGILLYTDRQKGRESDIWNGKMVVMYQFRFDFIYHYIYSENTKTFKLKNLPTTEPAEKGTVWIDGNTLKIKV